MAIMDNNMERKLMIHVKSSSPYGNSTVCSGCGNLNPSVRGDLDPSFHGIEEDSSDPSDSDLDFEVAWYDSSDWLDDMSTGESRDNNTEQDDDR